MTTKTGIVTTVCPPRAPTTPRKVADTSDPQRDCQTCGGRMQKWKHGPGYTPARGRAYYRFWFECRNDSCRTRQVMPRDGYVPAEEVSHADA